MRHSAFHSFRFAILKTTGVFLLLLSLAGLAQAQQRAAPSPERPKIRAITAFINLDRAQYR